MVETYILTSGLEYDIIMYDKKGGLRSMMWAISVRSPRASKMVKFEASPKVAVEKAKAVKRKYAERRDVVVELISLTKAFAPPEGFKRKGSKWWCPYCRKVRVFLQDSELNLKYCPVCRISDRDWYVRTYNNLWDKALGSVPRRRGR